jgi:CubicO group peptidase (beta-lactamase class C family)
MKFKSILTATFGLAALATTAIADDARWLTPTMVTARANMMRPELNYLTFQHMDAMFATRTTRASGNVWTLTSEPRDIGNDFIFEGKPVDLQGFLESTATNALLVIKDGKVATEIYRNGGNEKSRFISFSMAKSMLATMIGIAHAEGKIKSLDDKVIDYLPDWKSSAYANVTLRDMLRMRSGVDWLEIYEFGSKTQLTQVHDNSLVAYRYRWCDYARDKTKTANEPGKVFNYSTLDTSVLGCVLEKAVGMKGADYLSEKIWQPAGMEADGYYMLDGPDSLGREFYGAGFNATLRDFGRFGLMMLNDGVANGKQVVPAAWVKESTTPTTDSEPASPRDFYGYAYQWWTVPNSDAYSAIGLFNQFIFIDPSTKTVIVKLSSPASPLGWEKENTVFFQTIAATLAK